MASVEKILLKPLITEKAAQASEKTNRYGFLVMSKANKNQIKEAVEKLYDVKVLSVNTIVVPGKLKRFGRFLTRKTGSKKAFVQLSEGQKIEFFKGV